SIRIIGVCAFEGCSNLETLVIPEGVLSVGVSFISGSGIKTLSLPDSITTIMGGELKGSSCLESLTIPYIGFSVLSSGLTSAYYGFGYIFGTQSYDGSVATVQGYETYYIPETLTHLTVSGGKILSGAFSNSRLTSVTIGKNVTELSNSAFTGCTLLRTVRWNAVNCARSETDLKSPLANITSQFNLYIGEEVAALPDQAFASCDNLNNVVIENGLTTIGEKAFYNCARLFSVEVPASVTKIGDYAFYNCPILTNLYWSNGLTSVGKNAFGGDCSRISNIYYTGDIASWCGIQFNGDRANPLYVNPILYINNVRVTELEIPYGVTSIGDYAFYGYSALARIHIPDSVRKIGICAFEGTAYYNDESNWENSALYIGNHLIRVKTDVTGAINVKQDALTIADGAFYNCDKVTSVVIPNGITRIGNHVFYYCRALTNLEIPVSVTSIGNYAFYYCDSLSIDSLTGVTAIGEYAFYRCLLRNVVIADGVTSIGDYAFYYCNGLKSIEIPN
ncbi:MAG: leucine-rich repeat domain-containing protein, partial [Clostridia bacterium]|nr:leucine-rich repeat domain-containing protein [Clostridia bacterium]